MTETTAAASLVEACRMGNLDQVLQWCERHSIPDSGVRPIDVVDAEGRTAFHWAVAMSSVDLALQLLGAPLNANPKTRDADGVTPLISAVSARAPDSILAPLIAIGEQDKAWLNSRDEAAGNTALIAAVSRGNRDVVARLLQAGADPLLANRQGQTALHRATTKGNMDLIEDLVVWVRKTNPSSTKKFVNFQDANGDTALHHASLENNKEVGECLLRLGADRTIVNKAGREFWQV